VCVGIHLIFSQKKFAIGLAEKLQQKTVGKNFVNEKSSTATPIQPQI
jgi:hypothetical protein